jgi:hypothetical protein
MACHHAGVTCQGYTTRQQAGGLQGFVNRHHVDGHLYKYASVTNQVRSPTHGRMGAYQSIAHAGDTTGHVMGSWLVENDPRSRLMKEIDGKRPWV